MAPDLLCQSHQFKTKHGKVLLHQLNWFLYFGGDAVKPAISEIANCIKVYNHFLEQFGGMYQEP